MEVVSEFVSTAACQTWLMIWAYDVARRPASLGGWSASNCCSPLALLPKPLRGNPRDDTMATANWNASKWNKLCLAHLYISKLEANRSTVQVVVDGRKQTLWSLCSTVWPKANCDSRTVWALTLVTQLWLSFEYVQEHTYLVRKITSISRNVL